MQFEIIFNMCFCSMWVAESGNVGVLLMLTLCIHNTLSYINIIQNLCGTWWNSNRRERNWTHSHDWQKCGDQMCKNVVHKKQLETLYHYLDHYFRQGKCKFTQEMECRKFNWYPIFMRNPIFNPTNIHAFEHNDDREKWEQNTITWRNHVKNTYITLLILFRTQLVRCGIHLQYLALTNESDNQIRGVCE